MNDTQNERGEEIRAIVTAQLLLRDLDDAAKAPNLTRNREARDNKWSELANICSTRSARLIAMINKPRKPRVVAPEASAAAS